MEEQTSKIISALSDETRLQILEEIIEASKLSNVQYDNPAYRGNTTKAIKKKLDLAQSTISHHIEILEGAGIIGRQKQGKYEHFFVNFEAFEALNEFVKKIRQEETQKIEFFKTIELTKNFRKDYFDELISLLENHEYKKLHGAKRKAANIVYMRDKKRIEQIFHLIYNPQTQLITINIQVDVQDQINRESANELVKLIDKYLPTLVKQNLVIN